VERLQLGLRSFLDFAPRRERRIKAPQRFHYEAGIQYGTVLPMRFFLLFLCAAALLAVSGCASGEKSSARIYEGDAPSIKYHTREESAGGRLGGR